MTPAAAPAVGLEARVEALERRLRRLELIEGEADWPRARALLADLSALIQSPAPEEERIALEADPAFRARGRRIRDMAAHCAGLLEHEAARLADGSVERLEGYLRGVSESALDEMRAAGIRRGSEVLFIGSGPFPITAILMARREGCRVRCLDHDKAAAAASCRLFAALGLSGWIETATAGLESIDLGAFTHIVVASLVPRKEALLGALLGRVSSETRVIVRYGNGLKSLFNFELPAVPTGWRELSRAGGPGALFETVVLQAEGGRGARG